MTRKLLIRSATPPDPVDILIVDNRPAAASLHRDILSQMGFTSQSVTGLAGVLKVARVKPPRAVIVDTADPNHHMGADHLIRALRHSYPTLAIIAFCDIRTRCIEAIADEFDIPLLVQPIATADLFAALSRYDLRASPMPGSLARASIRLRP